MELNTLWFILIAILFAGYFLLEGFDFGVGILLPFLGKTDVQRRIIINTIGPHWDGNEVWLITAGGAMFAAFPHWYATVFSGFYLPLFLILLALIFRGVAFEFRSKDSNQKWRSFWDWAIFGGSILPSILWGVAFANFLRGVPIDAQMNYTGGFWNLLNPYALIAGITTALGFTLHGAIFLSLKVEGNLLNQVKKTASALWYPFTAFLLIITILTYFQTDLLVKLGVNPGVIPITAFLAAIAVGIILRQNLTGWAFLLNSLAIVATISTVFLNLYPRVLISSLNPEWNLTIQNAASSPYTLRIMSIVALLLVPIVLIYQIWSYRLFRKRLNEKSPHLEY